MDREKFIPHKLKVKSESILGSRATVELDGKEVMVSMVSKVSVFFEAGSIARAVLEFPVIAVDIESDVDTQ
jgi:hypothetical protein